MGIEFIFLAILGGGAAMSAFNGMEDEVDNAASLGFDPAEGQGSNDNGVEQSAFWQAENLWTGTDAADTPALTSNADLALGGAGDDLINGGAGDDRLLGEDGHDALFGGEGQDVLMDGQYDRSMIDQDELRVWINALKEDTAPFQDNDNFHGGQGDDVIHSMDGSDLAYGDEGDDLIMAFDEGEAGADGLFGGAGDDRLLGDSHDVMIGGEGADRFEADFSHNDMESGREGRVSILDFDPEQDQIVLHDEKAVTPEFDLDGDPAQELTAQTGHIDASEYGDYVLLDLVHLDGSVSELAQLRFISLEAVERAIAAGSIFVEAA